MYILVLKEVLDKYKVEGRCVKCERSNHQIKNCKGLLKVKTLALSGNPNLKLVQKNKKFDQR